MFRRGSKKSSDNDLEARKIELSLLMNGQVAPANVVGLNVPVPTEAPPPTKTHRPNQGNTIQFRAPSPRPQLVHRSDDPDSVIGMNLTIRGTISCENDAVRVEGNVQGDVHCQSLEVGRNVVPGLLLLNHG